MYERKIYPKPKTALPEIEILLEQIFDESECEATDGCVVEPDGECPHGYPAWPLYLGLI